jgi:hypothetical protein
MAMDQRESEEYEKAKISFREAIKHSLYRSCSAPRFNDHCDLVAERMARKYTLNDSVPSDADLRREFAKLLEELGQKPPTPFKLEKSANDVDQFRQVIADEPDPVPIPPEAW